MGEHNNMNDDTEPAFGLATIKAEGGYRDFETGNPLTLEQIAAYEAVRARRHQAMRDFETAVATLPDVIAPSWLAACYQLAEAADEREATTWLRRLVLWRTASGKIEHPQECAAIVMPEGEKAYSSGW